MTVVGGISGTSGGCWMSLRRIDIMRRQITRGALVSFVLALAPFEGADTALGQSNPTIGQPPGAVDGSILPFPPTPSGSRAGLTMQDSVYSKRVQPKRLADGAPNILIILMDDLGPATPS